MLEKAGRLDEADDQAAGGAAGDNALPDFCAADFADVAADSQCDLIMKGGITSGIVYPYAILEIATKYRLRSIGGTSAGAIAAAFAAAAEYARRQGDPAGFIRLKTHCDALPEHMLGLFQPDPVFRGPWDWAMGMADPAKGGWQAQARAYLHGAALRIGLNAAALMLIALALCLWRSKPWDFTLVAALLALIGGGVAASGWALWQLWRGYGRPARDALAALPSRDFGLCPGSTQPGGAGAGLTDWLYAALQDIAFGAAAAGHAPLTFGDLAGDKDDPATIDLKMVTTNLSMRRPVTLPDLGELAFAGDEWQRLFPAAVLDHLAAHPRTKGKWVPDAGHGLLPDAAQLPVIIGVRMSLSFPLLFSAVPLHGRDLGRMLVESSLSGGDEAADTDADAAGDPVAKAPPPRMARMLFSDGGISSNFPVHFFDSPLPSRPTFAFALEDLPQGLGDAARRIILPSSAKEGVVAPVGDIASLGGFGWSILNSAKDWQDQLLSELPGQRERVARIFLSPNEGGLNLTMPPALSRRLMGLGLDAGQMFTGQFNMDEHRWRRALVFYEAHIRLSGALAKGHAKGFAGWYAGYSLRPTSFRRISKDNRAMIGGYINDAAAVAAASGAPIGSDWQPPTGLPKVRARYQIRPEY